MGIERHHLLLIAGLIGFALLIWLQEAKFSDILVGRAQIIDGDSVTINRERVRLLGIDAPEGKQFCTLNGKRWACGRAATKALRTLVNGRELKCEGQGYDKHSRMLGVCYVAGTELNRWMVVKGWAVSFGGAYEADEIIARRNKVGIWQSQFEMPHVWRRANRRY